MASQKNKNKFPDESTLKKVRKKLSDPNYKGGNIALPPNASEVERLKYELCQFIAGYRAEHELLQKDIADQIGVDESRISDILRGKIKNFTLDRLVAYSEKLDPNIKIRITAA